MVALSMVASAAYARGPSTHHLGPIGILGGVSKTSIKVTKVEKGSPADGKLKVNDQIIGAGEANFKKDPRRELAAAINLAETKNAGGKLTLILQGNKKVELQLTVLGSYSKTAPYDCPKSEAIIQRAADLLIKDSKVLDRRLHTGLLGLMATGEKKYIDVATQIIKNARWAKPDAKAIDDLLDGGRDMGSVGWQWGYDLITLGEYHLMTKDKSVLPAMKTIALGLARGQDAGGLWGHRMISTKRYGRLPGYAQMNQSSLTCFMGMLFAKKCGVNDPVLDEAIQRSYAYFEHFVGRGAFPYGVHGPHTGTFNNNGTSGSAAFCMALKDNQEGAKFFSQLAATTYDGMESGHASTFFNPLWTPLGASLSGPEVTQQFFEKSLWLQTMYRRWDGNFSRFGGNSKEGQQAGVALLAYCLPRKAPFITGKEADESIYQKGQAATDVVGMSKIDYKNLPTEKLIEMAKNHPIPQVRRAASGNLVQRRNKLLPMWIKYLKGGTSEEKELAIGQYGWWIPINDRMPQIEEIGAILRDSKEKLDVRVAAAGSLAYFGKPAQKFYPDIVKLIAGDRPDDTFGAIDGALGKDLGVLSKTPFTDGLVKDKELHYQVALKLADHKRQETRADGLRMLADMPLEDFNSVADIVMHIIEDKDPTYHSYHSPGGPVGAAITILANLNIKEGIPLTIAVLDTESGKWGFKVRMVCATLPKYGANAKEALKKIQADPRLKNIEKDKFRGIWINMVKAIEGDNKPRKLITLEEAKKAGGLPRPSTSEERTFNSADGKKSFLAVLVQYDPKSGIVSVRKSNGTTSKFNIELLSKDDQEYVKKHSK
jgi:hypothetical protein